VFVFESIVVFEERVQVQREISRLERVVVSTIESKAKQEQICTESRFVATSILLHAGSDNSSILANASNDTLYVFRMLGPRGILQESFHFTQEMLMVTRYSRYAEGQVLGLYWLRILLVSTRIVSAQQRFMKEVQFLQTTERKLFLDLLSMSEQTTLLPWIPSEPELSGSYLLGSRIKSQPFSRSGRCRQGAEFWEGIIYPSLPNVPSTRVEPAISNIKALAVLNPEPKRNGNATFIEWLISIVLLRALAEVQVLSVRWVGCDDWSSLSLFAGRTSKVT